jgi:tetratricopeptide (TPR) repeat protein
MPNRLRPLWDFGDLDGSERRLREQLEREMTAEGRAEVLTQLARVEGLRGRFAEGDALLDDAAAAPRYRVDLERGRLRRSGGDPDAALSLFVGAYDGALAAGDDFLAADAAHMAALAGDMDGWTQRGIELAERSEEARYWLGPLLNNLGWERYEAGDFDRALDAFERALAARETDPARPAEIEIARYCVGKTLRALARSAEAIPLLEGAVESAERAGEPDSWFHEELAEEYAAAGRGADAADQAGKALGLLGPGDPRAGRLHELLHGRE